MLAPDEEARDRGGMLLALEEARAALLSDDVPVGAVLIASDGEVLGRGHNRREERGDPTAHAEILALQEGARRLGHWRLLETTLYVTLEPCVMCAGALVNARVPRLVYGCDDPKAGAIRSLYQIGDDSRLNHRYTVTPGVLTDEASALLKEFFADLRQRARNARPPR